MNKKDHQLLPCQGKPNCVSSLATNKRHYIKPFSFSKHIEQNIQQLCHLLASLDGVTIQQQDDIYIHAVCRSRVFGFKDDIEFLYDENTHVCNVRSASRLGYYDFGVNRRRVELVRKLFMK